jgi:ATP-binding cassette subfamily B protein
MGMFQQHAKPKDVRGTLLRLWGYLKRQRWMLVGVTFLVIASSIIDLLGPYLMGVALDRFIGGGDLPGLARLVGLMILTYVVAAAGIWLQTYLMAGVAQRAVREMRQDLFAKLQTLPLRFFDQRAHGELMSRLTNDVRTSTTSGRRPDAIDVERAGIIVVIVLMFAINVPLAVVSLIVMPLTYVSTRFIAKRTRLAFVRCRTPWANSTA